MDVAELWIPEEAPPQLAEMARRIAEPNFKPIYLPPQYRTWMYREPTIPAVQSLASPPLARRWWRRVVISGGGQDHGFLLWPLRPETELSEVVRGVGELPDAVLAEEEGRLFIRTRTTLRYYSVMNPPTPEYESLADLAPDALLVFPAPPVAEDVAANVLSPVPPRERAEYHQQGNLHVLILPARTSDFLKDGGGTRYAPNALEIFNHVARPENATFTAARSERLGGWGFIIAVGAVNDEGTPRLIVESQDHDEIEVPVVYSPFTPERAFIAILGHPVPAGRVAD
ncbi:MAG: hypothetical protein DRO06_03115 [Thermoproteota archaeon]|nr:MAG: hypothetical protein DRO06_03115 [Candidatus Korarchaeota archaeon]